MLSFRVLLASAAADWVCIAWHAFCIGFGFEFNAWTFLLQSGKGFSADGVVVLCLSGLFFENALRVPGGNQVDGLPPA